MRSLSARTQDGKKRKNRESNKLIERAERELFERKKREIKELRDRKNRDREKKEGARVERLMRKSSDFFAKIKLENAALR